MTTPTLLSLVIPVYRSERYLEATVQELLKEIGNWCPVEILLINDGSPDGVQAAINQLVKTDPRVRYLELGANRGQHFATLRGFGLSRGEVVVTIDDDGQNPPEAIKAVTVELLQKDADVVYGVFETTSQTLSRRLASRANRWMTKHTLGNTQGIALTNVRAIRGELARAVANATSSAPYIDALLWRSTRRIDQVVVQHRSRSDGLSTYTLPKLLRLWLSHVTLLTILPLQVASVGSLVVALLAFTTGVVQLIRALQEDRAPPGWLSLFLATTILFGVLFTFLGIVATYVGLIYTDLNARSVNWVRSTSPHSQE